MEIKVLQKVLKANESLAEENHSLFKQHGVFAINLLSSPGAGKTTLLEKTILSLKDKLRIGVVVGDVCTTHDAERLSQYNTPTIQINTDKIGSKCHLDANLIRHSLDSLDLTSIDLLFIENIGNLVCPAEFNLGEDKKVLVFSVPEGEDKPLKYPHMFQIADLVIVNKIDLIEASGCNFSLLIDNIKRINPHIDIFSISALKGEGLDKWVGWLENQLDRVKREQRTENREQRTKDRRQTTY